jgi:hypothetical protein
MEHFYNEVDFGPHRGAGPYDIVQSERLHGILHDKTDDNGLVLSIYNPIANRYPLYYVAPDGNTEGIQIDTAAVLEMITPGNTELSGRLNVFIGMYKTEDALYVIGQRTNRPHCIYKSVDNGSTWVEQDPQGASTKKAAYHINEDGKFYIVRTRAAGVNSDLDLIEFNTATDTYNTAHDTVTISWGSLSIGEVLAIRRLPNGDTCIFYHKYQASFPQQQVYMAELVSGVWTSDILISDTGRFHTVFDVEVQSDGVLHMFWRDQDSGGPPTYYENYRRREDDGTLSTTQSSGITPLGTDGETAVQSQHIVDETNDQLLLCTVTYNDQVPLIVVRGSPLLTPTFNDEPVPATGALLLTIAGYTVPSMTSFGILRATIPVVGAASRRVYTHIT